MLLAVALPEPAPDKARSPPLTFLQPPAKNNRHAEERKRLRDKEARAAARAARKQQLAAATAALAATGFTQPYTAAAAAPAEAPAAIAAAAPVPSAAGAGDQGAPLPDNNVFLFPGQGSQAVGMISPAAAALPAVQQMLEVGKKVLGYDLLELMQKGELWFRVRFGFVSRGGDGWVRLFRGCLLQQQL